MKTRNLYKEISDKIIEQLKKGIIPWHKPWTIRGDSSLIVSHSTGKGYSLLNALLLSEPGEYATFKQIEAEGGHVKKGAKSTPIFFWKQLFVQQKDVNGKPMTDKKGKPLMQKIPFLQYYNVFNILTDAEGIAPKFYRKYEPKKEKKEPKNRKAEKVASAYMKREKITLTNRKIDSAHYSPSCDNVQVPPINDFDRPEEYYSTLFHELTHSTGAEKRLDRPTMKNYFTSKATRATEELIAEIGAATSLSMLKIDNDKTLKNSTAYVQSWLRALEDDPKMVVVAAGKAEKAVDMIFDITHEPAKEVQNG